MNSERSEEFLKQNSFQLGTGGFFRSDTFGTIKMTIGINNWDVETYRNNLEKEDLSGKIN